MFSIGVDMSPQTIPMGQPFPDPPSDLKDSGRKAWLLGRQLWAEGVLTARDMLNWKLFCEAADEKTHCDNIVKKDGEYQMSPNGCYAQHPAIKRRQQAEAVIRKYSVAFGLIPEARKKRPSVQQGVNSRKR